jgi:hypothetical protein
MVQHWDGGSMECNVGIVDSQRAEISQNRIALRDKRTYASLDDAATFGERFWLQCAAAGAATAQQIVFVKDGAEWIHTLQQAHFPGAPVILDPWHMSGGSTSSGGSRVTPWCSGASPTLGAAM